MSVCLVIRYNMLLLYKKQAYYMSVADHILLNTFLLCFFFNGNCREVYADS
jgi:hypothetical protein